ncbi:MAG: hypothetical protein WD360_06270 [Nitriliruptoraceae bacterium]
MRMRLFILGVLGLWLLVPAVALAHPFVTEPVPVQSAATLTLDLAHGCVADGGAHSGGDGEPTRQIAVRFPSSMSVRTVSDAGGFTVEAAQSTGMYDEWTLRAADGVDVPAPVIAFAVVVDAKPTDAVWLQVFQGCDTAEHRWIATPDAPDGEPGVQVRLSAADPTAPPDTAPQRDLPSDNTTTGQDEPVDEESDEPIIDFIGIDVPQSNEAWLWYVLIAGVVGVLLAKRSRKQGR